MKIRCHLFLLFLFATFNAAGCTLMSVGNTVKKDFGPALSRGDVPALVRHSTPELGALFSHFTQQEIQQLLRWGSPPSGDGKSTSDPGGSRDSGPPKISGSLDSFSSDKNIARLRVKSGKIKYTFVCHRIKRRWRVHDIIIHRPQGDWHFSRILGLFASARKVVFDARQGTTNRELLHPELADALEPLINRLPPVLEVFRGSGPEEAPDSESSDNTSPSPLRFLDMDLQKALAEVRFAVFDIPVTIFATAANGVWRIRDIRLEPPERPPLTLSRLAVTFSNVLVASADALVDSHPEFMPWSHIESFIHPDLRAQIAPVLAPLWPQLGGHLAERFSRKSPEPAEPDSKPENDENKPAARPAPTRPPLAEVIPGLLRDLHWKVEASHMEFRYRQPDWEFFTRWNGQGMLEHMALETGGQVIHGRHLSGFAPLSRWLQNADNDDLDPGLWLRQGLRLLAEPYSGIEKLLPETLTLIPAVETEATTTTAASPGTAGQRVAVAEQKLSAMPPVQVARFAFTPELMEVGLLLGGRKLALAWVWRENTWRLKQARLQNEDLLPYTFLLVPLWRAWEGLMTLDAGLFSSALGPDPRKKLQPGLAEVFSQYERSLRVLFRDTLEILIHTLGSPPIWKNGPPKARDKDRTAPSGTAFAALLNPAERTLRVGGNTLSFAADPDGAWGILLPSPPPVRARREPSDHALAIVELWPTLAGLYFGLANSDLRALARFSSADFNARVWRRMNQRQFQAMMRKLGADVSMVTGRDVVEMLLPDRVPVEPPAPSRSNAAAWRAIRRAAGASPPQVLEKLTPTTSRPSAAGRAPAARILGTLVRSDRRYPFAEIWLLIDGRRVDINFSWDARRNMFVLNDIRVQLKVLGRDMTFGLKNNLNMFLK